MENLIRAISVQVDSHDKEVANGEKLDEKYKKRKLINDKIFKDC